MRVTSTIILLMNFILLSFGQNARFYTDTTRISLNKSSEEKSKAIWQQEWIINGQKLKYGAKHVQVVPNSDKLDTILFRGVNRKEYDTIICNISEPNDYMFYFNACCGAFNIKDLQGNNFIQGEVKYLIVNGEEEIPLLGILGETGVMIKQAESDTINPVCRSAMSPNFFEVGLFEVEECIDSLDCKVLMCLIDKENEYGTELLYQIKREHFNFLYMPLKSGLTKIYYDWVKAKIILVN